MPGKREPLEQAKEKPPLTIERCEQIIDVQAEAAAIQFLKYRFPQKMCEHLQRILTSEDPKDIAQRQKLFEYILPVLASGMLMESLRAALQTSAHLLPENRK
jgi:uncharacterized protein HemY